jgi:hypothetical protein
LFCLFVCLFLCLFVVVFSDSLARHRLQFA